jgi:undecaprenyl pyrophosphate synthase
MEQKHSPLPWKATAHLVYSDKGYLVAEALSQQTEKDCIDAQFIVQACNAYEANQQEIADLKVLYAVSQNGIEDRDRTIKGLLEACRTGLDYLYDARYGSNNWRRHKAEVKNVLETAITKAEAKGGDAQR